jgi:hypothetical protein
VTTTACPYIYILGSENESKFLEKLQQYGSDNITEIPKIIQYKKGKVIDHGSFKFGDVYSSTFGYDVVKSLPLEIQSKHDGVGRGTAGAIIQCQLQRLTDSAKGDMLQGSSNSNQVIYNDEIMLIRAVLTCAHVPFPWLTSCTSLREKFNESYIFGKYIREKNMAMDYSLIPITTRFYLNDLQENIVDLNSIKFMNCSDAILNVWKVLGMLYIKEE